MSNSAGMHPSEANRPGALRVLHVDDDPGLQEVVASILERHVDDLTVVPASDPDDAIGRVRAGTIDCVIVDPDLIDGDGVSLCSTVAREFDVPLILFTNRTTYELPDCAGDAAACVDKVDDVPELSALTSAIHEAV